MSGSGKGTGDIFCLKVAVFINERENFNSIWLLKSVKILW